MYLILDTETNSYHPGQIAQLSYIITDQNRQLQQANNFFFRVERMDPFAQAVHGFSKEQLEELSEGKTFADQQDALVPLLTTHTLVAHNASFDKKFISYELQRLDLTYEAPCLCTMHHFTPICKIAHRHNGGYKRPKLSELIEHFQISQDHIQQTLHSLFASENLSAHDARYDTVALFLVMQRHHQNLSHT